MPKGKLILTSRGLNTKIGRELIKKEIEKDDIADKNILLIYEPYFSIERILFDACKWIGFKEENIYLCHQGLAADIIKDMNYVYVTEGNTFEILAEIKRNNLLESIRDAFFNGTDYIGASAGALIAGEDIEIAKKFDSYDRKSMDFEALGLLNGIVIPHQSESSIKENFSVYALEQMTKYENIYTIEENAILII